MTTEEKLVAAGAWLLRLDSGGTPEECDAKAGEAVDAFRQAFPMGFDGFTIESKVRKSERERIASLIEGMIVGGRAWDDEQALAARILRDVASQVRKLGDG